MKYCLVLHAGLIQTVSYNNFSYVFWMGDLNFRLDEKYEKNPDEIERDIKKGRHKELLEYDQLQLVMKKGLAFSELRENLPCFAPTFKFEVGTTDYDHKYD